VRNGTISRKPLLALLLLAPGITGCSSGPDLFSKDADWFSRPSRMFIRNISIETPPLTPNKAVTAEDSSAPRAAVPACRRRWSGRRQRARQCAPARRRRREPAWWRSAIPNATWCAASGAPDNVNLSNGPRGGPGRGRHLQPRLSRRHLPFTAGRLSSVERGADPLPEPKAAKRRAKKKPAAT